MLQIIYHHHHNHHPHHHHSYFISIFHIMAFIFTNKLHNSQIHEKCGLHRVIQSKVWQLFGTCRPHSTLNFMTCTTCVIMRQIGLQKMRNYEAAACACTLVQGHKNYYTYLFQTYSDRIISFNSVNTGVHRVITLPCGISYIRYSWLTCQYLP